MGKSTAHKVTVFKDTKVSWGLQTFRHQGIRTQNVTHFRKPPPDLVSLELKNKHGIKAFLEKYLGLSLMNSAEIATEEWNAVKPLRNSWMQWIPPRKREPG